MRHANALWSVICLCVPLWAGAQSAPPAPGAAPAAAATPAASGDPAALVQEAAQGMLADIAKNRDAYRRDPAKVGPVVDKWLMPHFDTETSARVVLGQYWRTATPEQRQRFIKAFYHSLLTNYGDSLVDFTPDRLKIFPSRVAPGDTSTTVRTEVTRAGGDRVSVNYSLRMTPQGWKAWDVVIDGISYVKSYREDFGSQIQQQGLDTVIKRLESGEKPGQIAKQTGSG
ncbi:MAG TPA: ABC transporter substrate-binding protein [Steroidobacteraceae bacterium]|jgi:phospholipid transport system substrate-binding protein|nr:ABC transporter substrate-binding protein [Steroidobacteraceae bacterium]